MYGLTYCGQYRPLTSLTLGLKRLPGEEVYYDEGKPHTGVPMLSTELKLDSSLGISPEDSHADRVGDKTYFPLTCIKALEDGQAKPENLVHHDGIDTCGHRLVPAVEYYHSAAGTLHDKDGFRLGVESSSGMCYPLTLTTLDLRLNPDQRKRTPTLRADACGRIHYMDPDRAAAVLGFPTSYPVKDDRTVDLMWGLTERDTDGAKPAGASPLKSVTSGDSDILDVFDASAMESKAGTSASSVKKTVAAKSAGGPKLPAVDDHAAESGEEKMSADDIRILYCGPKTRPIQLLDAITNRRVECPDDIPRIFNAACPTQSEVLQPSVDQSVVDGSDVLPHDGKFGNRRLVYSVIGYTRDRGFLVGEGNHLLTHKGAFDREEILELGDHTGLRRLPKDPKYAPIRDFDLCRYMNELHDSVPDVDFLLDPVVSYWALELCDSGPWRRLIRAAGGLTETSDVADSKPAASSKPEAKKADCLSVSANEGTGIPPGPASKAALPLKSALKSPSAVKPAGILKSPTPLAVKPAGILKSPTAVAGGSALRAALVRNSERALKEVTEIKRRESLPGSSSAAANSGLKRAPDESVATSKSALKSSLAGPDAMDVEPVDGGDGFADEKKDENNPSPQIQTRRQKKARLSSDGTGVAARPAAETKVTSARGPAPNLSVLSEMMVGWNQAINGNALIERLINRRAFDGPLKVTDRKSAEAFLKTLHPKRIGQLTLDEFRLLVLQEPLLPMFMEVEDAKKICGGALVNFERQAVNGVLIGDAQLGNVLGHDVHVGVHLDPGLSSDYEDHSAEGDPDLYAAATTASVKTIIDLADVFQAKDQLALQNARIAKAEYDRKEEDGLHPSIASQFIARRDNCRHRITSAKANPRAGNKKYTSGNSLRSVAETVMEGHAWHQHQYGIGPMNDILTAYADSILSLVSILENVIHNQDKMSSDGKKGEKNWNSVPMQAIPYPKFDYHVFSPSIMHCFSKKPWNDIPPKQRDFKEIVNPRATLTTAEQFRGGVPDPDSDTE